MELSKIITRAHGLLHFHFTVMTKRQSIRYKGLKHYLGRYAKITTSDTGKIVIGQAIYISDRSDISAHLNGKLEIGNNNFFNTNTTVMCLDEITIGSNNLFAQNVVIVDHNHNYDSMELPICRQGYRLNPVFIGSDCWICANVVICPGAVIGDHIVIAANSVVRGRLTEPGLYAGAPAKLVKRRESGKKNDNIHDNHYL